MGGQRKWFGGLATLLLLLGGCALPDHMVGTDGTWQSSDGRTVQFPGIHDFGAPGVFEVWQDVSLPVTNQWSTETWLYLGRPEFPMELFFNGVFLYRRGNPPDNTFFFHGASVANILLPRALFHDPGTPNRITIRVYAPDGRVRFPAPPAFIDQERAYWINSYEQFLNVHIFLIFSGISVIGGLYFLVLWWGRRELTERFHFAMTAIFIGLYFFDFGSPVPFLDSPWTFPFMKACLIWAMGFLATFFITYYRIHAHRWLIRALVAAYGLGGLYVFLTPGNYLGTMDRFTLMMVPVQLGLLFVIYVQIRSMMHRNPDSWPILVGTILGVGFGSHDVYHQLNGTVPVVWMQGFAFFSLEASMFLSLALQATRMYNNLESYSRQVVAQKEELSHFNAAFARFVPSEFLKFLGKKSVLDVNLGDQVQERMTILFSDIRNFTQLSEQMSPRESFALINSYLNKMAPVVRERGGVVDKYIGDAIMALYPGKPSQAVESALAMRDRLVGYNDGRAKAGYLPIEMGIGIHAGSLMLGTIGEEHRMDSTVISDAVNTASRLESMTKQFKVSILISKTCLDLEPDLARIHPLRYLGTLDLRGRREGLGVYEVLHPTDDCYQDKLRHRGSFEEAVRNYESDGRRNGRVHFAAYRALCPLDPVLAWYEGVSDPSVTRG